MSEGSRHFEGTSAVQQSLRKITQRLQELSIPYAVAEGMALFAHGFRRFTEDVDVLVTRQGLKRIHRELGGLGYVEPFERSKHLRDAESGVKIEFLVTGDYPGDGKPKPVAFPDPESVAVERDGIKYLDLPALVELKLASGMTSSERMKDLADVQELIRILELPEDFSLPLNPFVRTKYREIWNAVHMTPKRFVRVWRNKFLTSDAKSLAEMVAMLRDAARTLEAMQRDGVVLEGGADDDYALLVTTDPSVAEKYEMHDEAETLDEDGEEED